MKGRRARQGCGRGGGRGRRRSRHARASRRARRGRALPEASRSLHELSRALSPCFECCTDYGSARCGCAVSDPTGVLATAAGVPVSLQPPGADSRACARWCASWSANAWSWACRCRCLLAFSASRRVIPRRSSSGSGVPVELYDEHHHPANRRRRRGLPRAAGNMLEGWLAAQGHEISGWLTEQASAAEREAAGSSVSASATAPSRASFRGRRCFAGQPAAPTESATTVEHSLAAAKRRAGADPAVGMAAPSARKAAGGFGSHDDIESLPQGTSSPGTRTWTTTTTLRTPPRSTRCPRGTRRVAMSETGWVRAGQRPPRPAPPSTSLPAPCRSREAWWWRFERSIGGRVLAVVAVAARVGRGLVPRAAVSAVSLRRAMRP